MIQVSIPHWYHGDNVPWWNPLNEQLADAPGDFKLEMSSQFNRLWGSRNAVANNAGAQLQEEGFPSQW